MIQSQDKDDPAYQSQTSAQQKQTVQTEKENLATGEQVRKLMDRLLLTKP